MQTDLITWINQAMKSNDIQWIYNKLIETGYSEEQFKKEFDYIFGENIVDTFIDTLRPKLEIKNHYPNFKTDFKNKLIIDGRVCNVLLQVKLPNLIMVDNFLSDNECDILISKAKPNIKRSLVIGREEDKSILNDARTSFGSVINLDNDPLIKEINDRIAILTNWPSTHQEILQVLNYKPGEEYKPHNDYFDPKSASTPNILKRGGNRLGSFIMYLNNCEAGGSTVFPETGIEIMPNKGCALFFTYPTTDNKSKTLHGGSPIVSGEKWIAVKWLREFEFI